MRYITAADLRARAEARSWRDLVTKHLRFVSKDATTTVFLSHSHLDREHAQRVREQFAQFGVDVYVDWLDDGLPEETSPATAKLLKGKIHSSSRFVLLATQKSLKSLWVPWELGCADGLRQYKEIAVLPILVESGIWRGTEYMGIYQQIMEEDSGFHVCRPDGTPVASLSDWLGAKSVPSWLYVDPR
jgi:hypothetical protein